MKLTISNVVAFFFLITYASAAAINLEARSCGGRLDQSVADDKLSAAGIKHESSGGCTNKDNGSCTSYAGICDNTVETIITLKKAAGVSSLTITGGTEVGHAPGTNSHGKGHKVDVRHSEKLDAYIHNTFKKIGKRGDGFEQWEAASGNIYCDEINHWDITVF